MLTKFLITSQIIVFIHIGFGEIAGASLLWSIKELVYLTSDRLKWLKVSIWTAFVSVIAAWIAGGSYYLFFYPQVKAVIKGGPEDWGHLIFTESKEHIFFLIPVLILTLAMFAQKKGHLLIEHESVKRKYLWLTFVAAALIFSMAIMGYMITWGARTALWVKAGL